MIFSKLNDPYPFQCSGHASPPFCVPLQSSLCTERGWVQSTEEGKRANDKDTHESQPVKVNLAQAHHARLLQHEFYTPILIGLERRQETGLALRVRDLFSFRREGLPITVRLVGYQGREGVWLIAVAFRIATDVQSQLEGIAYLNPRRSADYRLFQHLAKQDGFPLLFLNDNLKVGVGQEVVWSVYNRQQVRVLLQQLDHILPEVVRQGQQEQKEQPDAAFEAVCTEFQTRHSVETLLATQPHANGLSISPSFQGVVLE